MVKFLIQTDYNNQVKHDFCFALIQSIEYHNWLNPNTFEYILKSDVLLFDRDEIEYCVPIGSVEFVSKFLRLYRKKEVKPINIPCDLLLHKFTNRKIYIGTKDDFLDECFVKSNTKIKGFTNLVPCLEEIPDDEYFISEKIEIESEYRCFVYNSKLVGLQHYSGDFTLFPDLEIINEMISTYKSSPVAYTLDVGIIKQEYDWNKYDYKTVVIEVHQFFSCGLYGFANHKILPYMFIRCFNELIK